MLLGEPPPTQADVRFRLFGIPVRIHPFFWLVTLLLALGGKGKADPTATLVWIVVVFVSILVHELGHAMMQRRYGGRPWITLYGLGGLSSCNDCDRSTRSQIIIALAGPAAGFLLAGLVLVLLNLAGSRAGISLSRESIPDGAYPVSLLLLSGYFEPVSSYLMNLIVVSTLWVNVAWGLINLLPIYPLDGGRVAREILTLQQPRKGIVQSLQLSIGVAALMAIYGLLAWQSIFTTFMFGLLAYQSYQALEAYRRGYY